MLYYLTLKMVNDQSVYVIQDKKVNVPKNEKNVPFEDAIGLLGFGKFHLFLLCLTGVTLAAVISETMGMAFLIPAAQCDLELSSSDKGILSAVGFLGIIVSSHLWGYLSDTKGRQKVISVTLFIAFACTVLASIVRDFWLFTLLRFLTGFFISGPSASVYAYLGEFNAARYRASNIAWASLFVAVALISLPSLAWWILPQTWSLPFYEGLNFRPWRLFLIIMGLPGFISAICFLKMPETPKFLISQGRQEEAIEVLRKIYRYNTGKSEADYPVRSVLNDETEAAEAIKGHGVMAVARSMWDQTIPLLKPPHLKYFLIACALQFGLFLSSAGVGLWYPEIINRISKFQAENSTYAPTVCEVVESKPAIVYSATGEILECNDTVNTLVFIDNIILGVTYVIGYVLIGFLITPLGRKPIQAVTLFASGCSGIGLYFVNSSTGVLILFCLFLMLSGINVSVTNGAVVGIFPTNLRAMAVCVTLMMGRMGTVVGSNVVGLLLDYNCAATFVGAGALIIICSVLSVFLPNR